MLLSYHNTTTRHHNPQDLDLNLYLCENPKSRSYQSVIGIKKFSVVSICSLLQVRRREEYKLTLFLCLRGELPDVAVLILIYNISESRNSSVSIELGYGLDDRGSRVRFPMGAGNFSHHHRVQTGSGAHPASYPVGTRVSFLGGKAVGS
jgi:hypothetical protein